MTSSRYLRNANGEAERAVQTAKRILKQDDPWLGLMVYRDTVIAATGCSHAQLMMGRHFHTTLLTLSTALRPRWPNPDLVRQKDFDIKLSYRRNYDRHHGVRPLPLLPPGNTVKVRTDNEKSWTNTGVITHKQSSRRITVIHGPD